MHPLQHRKHLLMMLPLVFGGFACGLSNPGGEGAEPQRPTENSKRGLPSPRRDLPGPPGEGGRRSAVFAGGCFWCVEAVFEQIDGVEEVVSGYAGGSGEDADYEKVSSGKTGHAEAVRIVYDPARISYGRLLQVFFSTHDPTTPDRQGPDRGRQYRSAVFYASPEEREIARAYIEQLETARVFDRPIVTTLEPLTGFYPAEKYHQDYVCRNPEQPYVRTYALPKIDKVRSKFPDLLKKPPR